MARLVVLVLSNCLILLRVHIFLGGENSPGTAEMNVICVRLYILMSEFDLSDQAEPGTAKSRLASILGLTLACLMDPEITPLTNPR